MGGSQEEDFTLATSVYITNNYYWADGKMEQTVTETQRLTYNKYINIFLCRLQTHSERCGVCKCDWDVRFWQEICWNLVGGV